MFDELVLPERAELRRDAAGRPVVSLKLRLPWYRALTLSCIESLDISIDEKKIDPADIRIGTGDGHHSLAEAAELENTWWFQLDTAEVLVPDADGLAPGAHEVAIVFDLRIPYAFEPSGLPPFPQVAEQSRTVHFEGWDN